MGRIRQRGKGTWEITIDLGFDADGRRIRKYENVKGTKADAKGKMRELETAKARGIPIRAERLTVAEWLERWLYDHVAPRARQRTMERYRGVIHRHINPIIGHVRLAKLTPSDLRSLEATLVGQGMKPGGVGLVHNIVSGALKDATRMELVWRNVAKAVTPPKVEQAAITPPDIASVRRVLDLGRAEQELLFPALHLVAYTGLRRGEALGLRWQDVDLEAGTVRIAQTLGRSLDKGLIFQPPKTRAGRRVIDLAPDTIQVLREHRGTQLLQQAALEGGFQDQGLVFPNFSGGPLNPMALTRAWQRLAKRAGVSARRVHDLRHFHASVLLQNHVNPAVVRERLGHANITTTFQLYAHALPGWQREAAGQFADLMNEG